MKSVLGMINSTIRTFKTMAHAAAVLEVYIRKIYHMWTCDCSTKLIVVLFIVS